MYRFHLTIGNTTTHLLDNFPESNAHRHFNQSIIADFSRQSEDFCAFTAGSTDIGVPSGPLADNSGDISVGLHVINQGGTTIETRLGRIGGTGAGSAAAAFDGMDESVFLSTDKSPLPDPDFPPKIDRGLHYLGTH